jgi:hypothetical protein
MAHAPGVKHKFIKNSRFVHKERSLTNTWNLRILGTSPIWGLHRPGSGDFRVPAANEAGADQPRDVAFSACEHSRLRAIRVFLRQEGKSGKQWNSAPSASQRSESSTIVVVDSDSTITL